MDKIDYLYPSVLLLTSFSSPSLSLSLPRFYTSPYSIATNRMIAQTSITPFIAASPVSTYQVGPGALHCGWTTVFSVCICVHG